MKLRPELLSDNPELFKLIQNFKGGLTVRMERISDAFQRQDWDELSRVSHQLKGAAASYGFEELSLCASELEVLALVPGGSKEVELQIVKLRLVVLSSQEG